MSNFRGVLPVNFDQPFFVNYYSASHRKLVLSSRPSSQPGDALDIVFEDVLAMKVKSGYRKLSIMDRSPGGEIAEFLTIPERHADRYVSLSVGDGGQAGFVVCARLTIQPGDSGVGFD